MIAAAKQCQDENPGMSGLAFHQANGSDAAAVTYNTVNGVYGGDLGTPTTRRSRASSTTRPGQKAMDVLVNQMKPLTAEGLGQLVHRRGQRRDRPGQGLHRLQLDRRHRRTGRPRAVHAWQDRGGDREEARLRGAAQQDADVVPLGGMGMHVRVRAQEIRPRRSTSSSGSSSRRSRSAAAGRVPSRKDALASPSSSVGLGDASASLRDGTPPAAAHFFWISGCSNHLMKLSASA